MFIALRRLLEWILLVFVFFIFTLFMYRVVLIMTTWIEPEQYKVPKGHSIQVNEMGDYNFESLNTQQNDTIIEQLKVFYWLKQ